MNENFANIGFIPKNKDNKLLLMDNLLVNPDMDNLLVSLLILM
jgi:hypothetical protein